MLFDTIVIKTTYPTKTQEEKVFSQVDLEFAKKIEDKDVGLWDRFWDWLTNLIFGKCRKESITPLRKILWSSAMATFISADMVLQVRC